MSPDADAARATCNAEGNQSPKIANEDTPRIPVPQARSTREKLSAIAKPRTGTPRSAEPNPAAPPVVAPLPAREAHAQHHLRQSDRSYPDFVQSEQSGRMRQNTASHDIPASPGQARLRGDGAVGAPEHHLAATGRTRLAAFSTCQRETCQDRGQLVY